MHVGFVLVVVVWLVVIFRNLEFENDQQAHQQSQLQILRSAHQGIVDTMTSIYNTFSADGHEVCSVFLSFTPSEIFLHFSNLLWDIYIIQILKNKEALFFIRNCRNTDHTSYLTSN